MSQTSPLHGLHTELGAKFTDFGGWTMPVSYQSLLAEHEAVRSVVGWFDVSHLGRFHIQGPLALEAIDRQTTASTANIDVGTSRYALVLTESGGIADDIVIWRPSHETFIVLPNAANHEMVMDRFHRAEPRDLRASTVMLAIQGPEAPAVIESITGFAGTRFSVDTSGSEDGVLVAATGYTGERGGEVIVGLAEAESFARQVLHHGAVPCGLGARDTLRLEAALPLWGQDMDATVGPYEVGLGFAVDMDHQFIGQDRIDPATTSRRRLFSTSGRRIPRQGQSLLDESGTPVGIVTSGSFSPVRREGIGMGLVDVATDTLSIDMRGTVIPLELVPRRFI